MCFSFCRVRIVCCTENDAPASAIKASLGTGIKYLSRKIDMERDSLRALSEGGTAAPKSPARAEEPRDGAFPFSDVPASL